MEPTRKNPLKYVLTRDNHPQLPPNVPGDKSHLLPLRGSVSDLVCRKQCNRPEMAPSVESVVESGGGRVFIVEPLAATGGDGKELAKRGTEQKSHTFDEAIDVAGRWLGVDRKFLV